MISAEKQLEMLRVPALRSREEMLDILRREIYGTLPPVPEVLTFRVAENIIPSFCAGKAVCHKVTAEGLLNGNTFSFPFYVTMPTDTQKHPFFVHLNFRDSIPDRYQPTEELVDHGFAVLTLCYTDVTADNDDFTDGLAGTYYPTGIRKPDDAGKIALWAWAAHRMLDYAQSIPDKLDLRCAVVCGHSRLGKTALLAAATDPRFSFCYSNDSGCSGAAITRGKRGETVSDICRVFPYWFCENYGKYAGGEDRMPFDQHYLLASIAPRKVLIGSASEDQWADPVAEQLCCFAASPAFEKKFCCDRFPAQAADAFLEGFVGYHLRKGKHYFSREDWHQLIRFVNLHRQN